MTTADPIRTAEQIVVDVPVRHVTFGYNEIQVFEPEHLPSAQLGYSVDPEGKDLTSRAGGDWQPNWVVIGLDVSTGDPIFVDTGEADFPVYTAAHGMGSWDPDLVAVSFASFCDLLQTLSQLSVGRSNPVDFEQNPVPDSAISAFLKQVSEKNAGKLPFFWELLFDQDI